MFTFGGRTFRAWATGLGGNAILLAALATTQLPPIDALLITPLETRFPSLQLSAAGHYDGIIALGGHPERVVEAVRLAHQFPAANLVIAGRGEERQHAYTLAQGIAADRVMIEPNSRNTYENAAFSGRLLQPGSASRWLLVTSSSHMPRAVGSFRKAGFDVMPWPVSNMPQSHGDTRKVAQHEWLGLLAYRLLGRTESLFPAPADRVPPIPAIVTEAFAVGASPS